MYIEAYLIIYKIIDLFDIKLYSLYQIRKLLQDIKKV